MQEEKNTYRKSITHYRIGENRTGCNRVFSWTNQYTEDKSKITCRACAYKTTGIKPPVVEVKIKKHDTIISRINERISDLEKSLEINRRLLESYEKESL